MIKNIFLIEHLINHILQWGYNEKIYGEIGNDRGRQKLSNIIPKGYNTIDDLLKGAKFQLLIKSLK